MKHCSPYIVDGINSYLLASVYKEEKRTWLKTKFV